MAHPEEEEARLEAAALRQIYNGFMYKAIREDADYMYFDWTVEAFVTPRNDAEKKRAEGFLAHATADPEMWRKLASLDAENAPKDRSEEGRIAYTRSLIEKKALSRELWLALFDANKRAYVEYQSRFEKELLPKLEDRFVERIDRLKKKGLLPISREKIEDAFERMHVELGDEDAHEASGTYGYNKFVITLATRLFDEYRSIDLMLGSPEIERTYTHELFHALSAKLVMKDEDDRMRVRRVGFKMVVSEKEGGERFRWLNEAMTEYLSDESFGGVSDVYAQEKVLLNYLMEGGKKPIPRELFANAYFEDHEPGDGATQTIPHWRILRAALNESFGPTFLVDLDKAIQKHGIAKVLQKIGEQEEQAEGSMEWGDIFEEEGGTEEGEKEDPTHGEHPHTKEHGDHGHDHAHEAHGHDDHGHGHGHADKHDDHGGGKTHSASGHGEEKKKGLFGAWWSFFGSLFAFGGETIKGFGTFFGKGGGGGGGESHGHH